MGALEQLVKTTESRVPPVFETHRESTDEFLNYFEHRLLAAIDAGRQLTLTDTSDSLKGQLTYWRTSVRCIRWLRAMNKQRRRRA